MGGVGPEEKLLKYNGIEIIVTCINGDEPEIYLPPRSCASCGKSGSERTPKQVRWVGPYLWFLKGPFFAISGNNGRGKPNHERVEPLAVARYCRRCFWFGDASVVQLV